MEREKRESLERGGYDMIEGGEKGQRPVDLLVVRGFLWEWDREEERVTESPAAPSWARGLIFFS